MSLVPVVASVDELPDAVKYAERNVSARWYVSRRAQALGQPGVIPDSWGEAVVASTASEDMTTERRQNLAKRGIAMKDGGYPIPDRTYLAKAVKAYGRAKNKAAVKRHIVKRARALHSTDMIPDSWKPLTAAAEAPADEAGLWVAQVRDLIVQAGHDPDEFEAGTDGFEADYEEYRDDPQVYVDELVAANTAPEDDAVDTEPDSDEAADDGDGGVDGQVPAPAPTDPQAPSLAPAAPVPVAASTGYATGANGNAPGLVQVFTAPHQQHPLDQDALLAAVRQIVKDEIQQATPTAPAPAVDEVVEAAAAPGCGSVPDLEAAKAALRAQFGKPASKRKPQAPSAAPAAPPMTASAMRERIAAKTPPAVQASAMRARLAGRRAAAGG